MGGTLDQIGGYILGLIGASMLGGMLYLGYATTFAATTAAQTLQLANDARAAFAGSYTTLTNAIAEQGGIMPDTWIKGSVGAGNDLNPWGGAVAIFAQSGGNMFEVRHLGVPSRPCFQLAQALQGGAVNIAVNGPWRATPVDAATILGLCNRASNTVEAEYQ